MVFTYVVHWVELMYARNQAESMGCAPLPGEPIQEFGFTVNPGYLPPTLTCRQSAFDDSWTMSETTWLLPSAFLFWFSLVLIAMPWMLRLRHLRSSRGKG